MSKMIIADSVPISANQKNKNQEISYPTKTKSEMCLLTELGNRFTGTFSSLKK